MCDCYEMPSRKFSEVALRLLLDKLCRILPDRQQYVFLAGMKKIKNILFRKDFNRLLSSWDHFHGLESNLAIRSNSEGIFIITHDVDYKEGYEYLPGLIEVDRELDIRATYNVLTNAQYELENRTLFSILDNGNEIGLHGKTHDRALGFRSHKYIYDFISFSKKELEERIGKIYGFRAPALAISEKVVSVLEKIGFTYDSSLTNSDLYTSFTPNFVPYIISNSKVIEIPLTIQDSMFVNDIPLSVSQIDRVFKHLIDMTERNRLTLVLNCHPIIIKYNHGIYTRIVQLLRDSPLTNRVMKNLPDDINIVPS